MIITVYGNELCHYGLITDEEDDLYGMFTVFVPDKYVRAWYENHKEDFNRETKTELGKYADCTFENWLNNVYTCDDFWDFFNWTHEKYCWLPAKETIEPY